jgi:hypothetical protein
MGRVEQVKVLAAALALRDFTVDEISGLSGVNTSTVRSVLKRNAKLVRRIDDHDDVVNFRRGRGRPANRWVVVDCDEVRRLANEIGSLPKFEPSYANVEADDWRSVAVAVAEDALTQVSDEADPMLRERLFSSARSSLFFAESGSSASNDVPWWRTEDSSFAVRARGVDALATLALLPADGSSTADVLRRTARDLAAAMLALPDRGEATYFAPFSQVLARSGEFAPMYALCASRQEPLYPLAGVWTEVVIPDFLVGVGRVLTQAWAEPLVNVSASMPVVVSSRKKMSAEVDQMIDSIKMMPRPAVVFGPLDDGSLIRKSGWAGASFIPVDEPPDDDRQNAIDSVVALIDRFSMGQVRAMGPRTSPTARERTAPVQRAPNRTVAAVARRRTARAGEAQRRTPGPQPGQRPQLPGH